MTNALTTLQKHAQGYAGDKGVVAMALITDSRMETIWRSLEKRRPALARHELAAEYGSPHDMTDAEVAMVLFLRRCVLYGTCRNVIDTVGELRKWAKSYQDQARRLRAEAKEIRDRDCSGMPMEEEIEVQARVLEKVAAWCDQEAAIYRDAETANDPESPTIKRNKGWRREMGLVDMIADSARSIYGSPLYGITATIVNVITGRDNVTPYHVRDWLKTLRIRGA
jgi:hypothetical protein